MSNAYLFRLLEEFSPDQCARFCVMCADLVKLPLLKMDGQASVCTCAACCGDNMAWRGILLGGTRVYCDGEWSGSQDNLVKGYEDQMTWVPFY